MTLGPCLAMPGVLGVIAIVIGFALWFFLTCAILICMEGCSAMVNYPQPPTPPLPCLVPPPFPFSPFFNPSVVYDPLPFVVNW